MNGRAMSERFQNTVSRGDSQNWKTSENKQKQVNILPQNAISLYYQFIGDIEQLEMVQSIP